MKFIITAAAFPTGSKASRLITPTEIGQGQGLVEVINGKLPAGGARVHLFATFKELPQRVQDAAKDAGVKSDEFFGVTMAKGLIFVIQDIRTGLVNLENTYYQCASAGLNAACSVYFNVLLALVKVRGRVDLRTSLMTYRLQNFLFTK